MPGEPVLSRYARPSVAIDLAVMTVVDDALHTVLHTADGPGGSRPALPGRFIRDRQTVGQTVDDVLVHKLRLPPVRRDATAPLLLRVFDQPDRDPRGWTLSLGYSLTLSAQELAAVDGDLVEVLQDGSVDVSLPFDHAEIVAEAAARIRARYEAAPDPDGLLTPPTTLSGLRRLHEAVLGEPLRKDTFNRRMRDQLEGLVEDETEQPLLARESVGRPAQMFTWSTPGAAPAAAPAPMALPREPDASRSAAAKRRRD